METNVPPGEEPQTDLFDSYVQYREASQGSRFLNFIIDNILMRLAMNYLIVTLVVRFLEALAPDFLYSLAEEGTTGWRNVLVVWLVWDISYIFYYTICEAAFKGYTLGKAITGTKAIRQDGNPLTFKDALLRSLCRIVPFEAFSGLGTRPWHDTWTKTMVVRAR